MAESDIISHESTMIEQDWLSLNECWISSPVGGNIGISLSYESIFTLAILNTVTLLHRFGHYTALVAEVLKQSIQKGFL